MSWDYCEWPEFYSESRPKARKQYHCVECSAPILKGEVHLSYRGKWDGDFSTGRQHLLCMALCIFIKKKYNHGECIYFGGLKEAWFEMDWSGPSQKKIEERDIISRSMMAKIKWRERSSHAH